MGSRLCPASEGARPYAALWRVGKLKVYPNRSCMGLLHSSFDSNLCPTRRFLQLYFSVYKCIGKPSRRTYPAFSRTFSTPDCFSYSYLVIHIEVLGPFFVAVLVDEQRRNSFWPRSFEIWTDDRTVDALLRRSYQRHSTNLSVT